MLLAGAVMMMIAGPVLGWYQFVWSQRFFNLLASGFQDRLNVVIGFAVGLFAIKMLESALLRFNGYLQESLSLNLNRQIESYQFELIQPTDITQIETPSYQNDLNLLKNNLMKIGQIIQSCITVVKEAGVIVVYAYLVSQYSWLILAVILVLSFPNLLYVWKHARQLDTFFGRISQAQMEAGKVTGFLTLPMALKEMLIFAAKPFFLSKWNRATDRVIQKNKQLMRSEYSWGLLVDLFVPVKYILTQLILIRMLYHHQIQLGDYLAITAAVSPLENALRSMFVSLDRFKYLRLFREKWKGFERKYLSSSTVSYSLNRIDEIREVAVDKLTFVYPDRSLPALNKVSLRLNGKTHLAIIGANGSGKSTLAKIMAGLHQVPEKSVFFNGVPIEKVDRTNLFEKISITSQDFIRYPLSIYENICMKEYASKDDDYLRLIERYPELVPDSLRDDPSQLLGNDFLGAVQVSGGQWQRIAIARGLYKGSDVLILDEATSELDPVAEMEIVRKILADRQGKMTIVVTHNMNLARMTDFVLVLNAGEIEESGAPDALLRQQSKFKHMWDMQGKDDTHAEVRNQDGLQDAI